MNTHYFVNFGPFICSTAGYLTNDAMCATGGLKLNITNVRQNLKLCVAIVSYHRDAFQRHVYVRMCMRRRVSGVSLQFLWCYSTGLRVTLQKTYSQFVLRGSRI